MKNNFNPHKYITHASVSINPNKSTPRKNIRSGGNKRFIQFFFPSGVLF